jgi:hypothetical protein
VLDTFKLLHAAGRYEKRMAGMVIRAGYHDAMSIDVGCRKKTPGSIKCGGAGVQLKFRTYSSTCCHQAVLVRLCK